MRYTIFFLAALFLNACSSLPEAVRGDFATAPFPAVQTSSAEWAGKTVRWGGEVVRIENRATETWVEIVAQPLDSDARPTGSSEGRFFAVFPGFLDPMAYGAGRELTVVGRIEGTVEKNIGDFPYQFPIVRVERHYFWPPPRPVYDRPYYWRDPWYDPWYPYIYPPWY